MIIEKKKTSIILGSTATRKPTETQEAFQRPASESQLNNNRLEGKILKETMKKPNFSIAVPHNQKYYESSTAANNFHSARLDYNASIQSVTGLINDRRLDAKSTHFKVGFDS